MKALFKILGISAAVLATLAIGAAIFIGWFFDPNDYKDYVAEWVETRTGRDFVIEDDLALTFFPPLGVETGGLRLGNAEGFGDDAFATAESAVLRVKLLPLLLARVELGNLEVDGLRLNLGRDIENRGNWEDLLADPGPGGSPSLAVPGGNGMLQNLNIEGVEITNGLIFWREDTTEVRYIVSELSLETGPILIGQSVRAELGFELVGVEPQFTAQLTATANALINPSSSRYLAEDLRLGFYLEDGRHEERAAGSLQSTISLSLDDRTISFSESQLEASLRNPPIGPAALQVGATWSSSQIDLSSGTVDVTGLATNTNGILASWELAGRALLDEPELAGQVRVADESLGAALDLLSLPIQAGRDADTLGGFDLAAEFLLRAGSRELALSELSVSALGMELSGTLNADAAGNGYGRISIPSFDPRAVLDLVSAEMLVGADYSGIDSLALAAEFQMDGPRQQTSIRGVRAEVMDASITGDVDYFGAERRLEGSVSTTTVDPDFIAQVFPNLLPPALTTERLGSLRMNTEFAFDTVTGELRLAALDAEVIGLQATGDLAVSELLADSPRWTGTLHIQRFNPRDLFRRFDVPPQVNTDPSVLTSAIIDTRVDITAERGDFEEMRLQLDDSTITGNFTVREFRNPEYDFSLAIDEIDIDRYLPPPADGPNAASGPAERPLELPTEAMHSLALNGRVVVDDLKLAGVQFSAVSTLLDIRNGVGTIDLARAELYGGDFEGGVELDARSGIPQLMLEGTAVDLQLDPLLVALHGESNLSGTGNFDLSLSGIGAIFGDAVASAAGRVDFSLREGTIQGLNLGHTMCDYWTIARREPRPAATDTDFTAYQLLRGSAIVTDGIARTNDLQATTSFMEVTGRGQLDMATRDINYDLITTLTDSVGVAGCETLDRLIGDPIPLELTGNVNAPDPSFDLGQALRDAARAELEAARDEAIDSAEDRLRDRFQELLSD